MSPIAPHQAGCCGYATGPHLQSAKHCPLEPAWAGTVRFPGHGAIAAFACTEHQDLLDDPKLITPGDRYDAELVRRRERLRRAWNVT